MAIALRQTQIDTKVILPFAKVNQRLKRAKDLEPPIQIHDPYVYGWRYLKYTDINGKVQYEQIPLTIEDILHPQENDYRMHAYEHEDICRYLGNVFKKQTSTDPQAVVLLDVRTAWDKLDLKPHTPDISVVFNVKKYQNWTTFYENTEGTRPQLIVEVTSPETRHLDLDDKVKEYAKAGVEYYFIIDHYKYKGNECRRLLGYRLAGKVYEALKENEQGWVWLEPLHIWLAWTDDKLVCYDEANQPILDYVAESKVRVVAEQLAKAESEARVVAEQLAKAESEACAVEAKARAIAEAKLRQLEEELRLLRK